MRYIIVYTLLVFSFLVKAQPGPGNAVHPVINMQMVTWLDTTPYFFWSYENTSLSEPVWKNGAGKSDLIAIVNDTTLSFKPRFLAAEILFARDSTFPKGMNLELLGRLYADALAGPVAGANEWGKPFEKNRFGVIGPQLLRIGDAAVPALSVLLSNDKKIYYAGGDKSTEIPNSYRLRIKDFAAFYICQLKGWKYKCYKSPRLRNIGINKLKRKLNVN